MIEVGLLEYPEDKDWMKVKQRALVTVGKEPVNPPSMEWKMKILEARHSPIRKLQFSCQLGLQLSEGLPGAGGLTSKTPPSPGRWWRPRDPATWASPRGCSIRTNASPFGIPLTFGAAIGPSGIN